MGTKGIVVSREVVVHLNFRAGSTFSRPSLYCIARTLGKQSSHSIGLASATRLTRSDFRLNLLLLKIQRCMVYISLCALGIPYSYNKLNVLSFNKICAFEKFNFKQGFSRFENGTVLILKCAMQRLECPIHNGTLKALSY